MTSLPDFQNFPKPPEALSQSAGAAKGRAAGLMPHEACFNVALGTAQMREARPRQFPCLGAVAPKLREDAVPLRFSDIFRADGKVRFAICTVFVVSVTKSLARRARYLAK